MESGVTKWLDLTTQTLTNNGQHYLTRLTKYLSIFAFDEGERTLIEIFSRFYGLYDVVNLAPPENFSGANDVISMPCASVLLFGVISLDKIVVCYGVLSLLFGGFSSKVEDF